ncbi:MAG: sugar ABC transporter substrate-binding protein [bacterium]|nr:sugar ABC transporter substrate-binding protein [bacterium]
MTRHRKSRTRQRYTKLGGLLLIAALLAASCSDGDSAEDATPATTAAPATTEAPATTAAPATTEAPEVAEDLAEDALIQLLQPGEHSYIQGGNDGFEAEAARLGLQNAEVKVGDWSVESQVALVQNAISQGAQGIIIQPTDSVAIAPAIDDAIEAGVCVVMLVANAGEDSKSVYPGTKGFVGWDEYENGQIVGRALAERIGGSGKIVIVAGTLTSGAVRSRVDGVEDVLAESFPDIEILTLRDAGFAAEDARKTMQDLIQRYGDEIDGAVFTQNVSSVAAADVIEASPLEKEIPIASMGGQQTFINYIAEGKLWATTPEAPFDTAAKALELTVDCINGDTEPVYFRTQQLDSVKVLADYNYLITEENLDLFTPQWD